MSIEHLLRVIDAYCAATGLAEATVSAKFLSKGTRAGELRKGSDMGARTIQRAISSFSDSWPAGAAWPEDVSRPIANLQSEGADA
ncbi:hypothetical protein [Methylosinus sp. PW1]|uniref:hypothetical protein n=1 Tax=Methylosinus sp. PW1 TaxID=107636 RepID=UPI00056AF1ED|nr:hypothetical protein [Methylosinus sp. PW1]